MSVAYAWQKLYEAAVVQTDFEKLPGCIAKTELAIEKRLAENPRHLPSQPNLRPSVRLLLRWLC